MMAISTKQALTADEFWELPEVPGKRLELVDGEVVEMPGAGGVHVELMLHIFDLLRGYIKQRSLGRIYPDSLAYRLERDPDTLRIPDISFIRSERIPPDWPPVGYSEVVPDLVVEFVSPSNTATDLRRRVRDYLSAGVEQVWVVWPEDKSMSVYSDSLTLVDVTADDTLDGGDILPGFSVKVADLFDID